EAVRLGSLSSLQPANVRLRRAIRNLEAARDNVRYPLLFDPQTSGGLLASMRPEAAQACLRALHELGYEQAAIIGRVTAESDHLEPVTLISRPH
ncbi:MAG: bifunctional NADH dehydrogenase FAD-containing subunit/selenide, water dikinase SelD, partial [Alphaproteobacteria bacterium]|nr:bifunctional NADH dehydrogenase FAD-containing subunit/selenide, water dikinase SelD [Alphaproteobacteria bacterium]